MLLAIDTATRLISLALHDGQTVAAESTWQTDQYHTAELAPQAALLLRRAGVEPSQLQAMAVAIGPGSYTGLRIGLGFAKGLALAQGVPLVGVPTLDGLMRAQPQRAERALALLLRLPWFKRQRFVAHNAVSELSFLDHFYAQPGRRPWTESIDCSMQMTGLVIGSGM